MKGSAVSDEHALVKPHFAKHRILAQHGFSIIEITLAIAIMAMGMVMFLPVFSQGISFTKDIRDYSILAGLAEELTHNYINQINTGSGSTLNFFENDITTFVKTTFKNDVFDGLPKFRVLATVRPSVLCDAGGYEIVIKIHWETGGRNKEFSLFTVKAEKQT